MTARSLGILILALATLAEPAAAGLLAYEGFQYVPGQPLPTMAGGSGWAPGPWTGSAQMVDQPPTLGVPTALPSSGDALLNPAVGEAFRSFAAPLSNAANEVWISFQEQTIAATGGAVVDLFPVSGFPLIEVAKASGGSIALNGGAAGLSAGVFNTDFFVLQVTKFNGVTTTVNLFVNPGVVLGAPSATVTFTLPVLVQQFYFRTDAGQLLDEIRAGTTLQDVAAATQPGDDTDGDGIPDGQDNCIRVPNPNQRDTNGDGYGNLCDPDFNNDGVVNINDFNRLKARLGISPVVDVDTDLDGNGAVNINDLNRLKSFLGQPPGPSGFHPNCPPTCP